MRNINTFILESMINAPHSINLTLLEMLAFYTMIDLNDCGKNMQATKRKLESALRSHVTYLLRECPDIAKKYDHKTIFNEKSNEELANLLDIIISEIEMNKR